MIRHNRNAYNDEKIPTMKVTTSTILLKKIYRKEKKSNEVVSALNLFTASAYVVERCYFSLYMWFSWTEIGR